MASTINASTSSGLVNTADTSGVLQLQTANTAAVTIDASQNVGVGTASPAYKLDVSGQARVSSGSSASALIATSTNAGGTALNVQNSGTVNMLIGGYNSIVGSGNATDVMLSATQGVLAFGTGASSTERMRIDTSGRVNIGQTASTIGTILEVASANSTFATGTPQIFARSTNAYAIDTGGMIGMGGVANSAGTAVAGYAMIAGRKENATSANYAGYMAFATSNTGNTPIEQMRITSAGDLLVATTDPANASGIGVKIAGVNSGPYVSVVNSSSSGSTFGIGLYSTGASAFRFYVDCGGTIHATSTSIAAISDASLKENIKDLETGLTEVMALKPRRFDWVNGDATNVAGFIAQEVETVLPELVMDSLYSKDEEGNEVHKKNLKMGDILPTLVKAIQEQQALITDLTTRLAALEGAK